MSEIVSITIDDHSKEVIDAMKKQVQLGLNSIGQMAEDYAKGDSPVDTGRMRNSITYATADYHSDGNTNKTIKGMEDAKPEDYATHATPEEKTLYLGTNVEYAEAQELTDMSHKVGKPHFLRDAISTHDEKYKSTMKAALDT